VRRRKIGCRGRRRRAGHGFELDAAAPPDFHRVSVQGVKRPEQWLCVVALWVVARLRRVSGAKRGATAPQAVGGSPSGARGGNRHRTGARTRWTREARQSNTRPPTGRAVERLKDEASETPLVDCGGTGRGLEGAGVSLKEKTTRPRRSAAARRWRSPEGVRKPGALWAADEQRRRWSPAPPHRPPDPASLLLGGTTHLMSLFPRGLCLSTESVRVPPVRLCPP